MADGINKNLNSKPKAVDFRFDSFHTTFGTQDSATSTRRYPGKV